MLASSAFTAVVVISITNNVVRIITGGELSVEPTKVLKLVSHASQTDVWSAINKIIRNLLLNKLSS